MDAVRVARVEQRGNAVATRRYGCAERGATRFSSRRWVSRWSSARDSAPRVGRAVRLVERMHVATSKTRLQRLHFVAKPGTLTDGVCARAGHVELSCPSRRSRSARRRNPRRRAGSPPCVAPARPPWRPARRHRTDEDARVERVRCMAAAIARIAPPRRGSTGRPRAADALPGRRNSVISASASVDLPAPAGP